MPAEGFEIEILHTACDNATRAESIARELASARDDVSVVTTFVRDQSQAASVGFRGSPTVLVNGQDVEAEPSTPVGSMG